ncbi:MAG TPA: cytochrome P450 [Pseudomonadales bacterium]|nr:cytochrome P450 [Pseudomonadales bacterium]
MDEQAELMKRHFQNPYASYSMVRGQRLFKDARGMWYVGNFQDVDAILKDKRFGKKALPGTEHRLPDIRREAQADELAILNIDPPDHTRIRGLLTKAFSAPRIEAMRPTIRALVDSLVDGLTAGRSAGAFEVMREFAFPIPATIISDMLGIPESDRDKFAKLSSAIIEFGSGVAPGQDEAAIRARSARAKEAVKAFDGYLGGLFETKRRALSDDLTTALIRAEDEQGKLSEQELRQNVRLLFMAGHETTVNLIGNALVALYNHPAELAKLKADSTLWPQAVEEFLRFDSSVQQLPRVAQADVEIGGQTILAGEMVVCVLGSANRDPGVYEHAEALDVARPFVRSKSFGGGAHFCLGAQLARIETEIALEMLLRRVPNLDLTNLAELEYPLNPFFRGPVKLLARWHR